MFSGKGDPQIRKSVGLIPKDARYRAWCVLSDGRVGYIDHYKTDGRFGIRPVWPKSGLHYPNPSEHWSQEEREQFPEELALKLSEFRAATDEEIPRMYRV